ncbi:MULTISPECIES: hypothetical protein [Streptococcus]|uniref:Uncharacterized protein n=1 Tax=Streptococcus koreensis TaxID=2382163 RepID=A0ABN5PW58_9STRE|nr:MULTISPECIES: hypothetical protein [Streptococcus]AGY38652.1 hypothetical protein N597_06730 [Streptococcus ilei]AYF94126.1 hypothetical protein D7D50_05765 [Streptococcus koreensis]MTQ42016.1 hypothetical protein [Streptococcus sp. BIOML-A1]RJU23957.1 hypothetical protein DW930_04820 [Streptococcus sp. AM43-2AT]RYS59731.1 hypothetical protein EAI95_04925 [Streptococcus sp. bf_0095]
MNQEEWLAEFERVHGRPATQEEIQEAFGMFGSPETQATPDTPVNPIQSPFEGAAPVSNQGQFGGPLPFPEQAKFGDAAPTPEQTPFGGATPTPEQTQFGGPTPTQAPFGGASSAPNQFQGGTSPFQQQGQAFGQGGVQPQAPVQGSAQAGATFSPYNNSQMQGGYPNNGQLNYQTNSPYMGQAPIPGKKSKKGLIIGLCSLVAVAILAVLAFFLFFKNSNNIQGKWSATPEMKKTMKSAFSGTFSTASDISSEFVKDMDMIVEVEGKKVTISVIGKIDFKGAAKELYDDGDNDFYSVEDALDYIQENSENSYLEDLGLEIDVKKGTLKMVAFEGEVDEKDHRFIQDEDASHFLKYDLKYKIENGTLKVSVDGNDYGIEYSFKK